MERRKERRIKVNLPIKIVYKNGFEVVGKTENISRLGTYVEIDRKIPAGADIDITLESPKGVISCKGNIFRCNLVREVGPKKYYGMGIFFTDFLNHTDRNKLSEYIDSLIANEDKNIKAGLKRWRKKRDISKQTKQEKPQIEILNLLKKILNHLEKIDHLLRTRH